MVPGQLVHLLPSGICENSAVSFPEEAGIGSGLRTVPVRTLINYVNVTFQLLPGWH